PRPLAVTAPCARLWAVAMRKTLRIAGIAVGLILALFVIKEAFFSLTTYFFIVPWANIYANDKPIQGYLHWGGRGTAFYLTMSSQDRRESYFVAQHGEKGNSVSNCGDWHPGRVPIMAIGDYGIPCLNVRIGFSGPALERNLILEKRLMEFTADD